MIESLTDFYKNIESKGPENDKGQEFVDIQQSRCHIGKVSFSYRDFYKIGLVLETGKLYYADKWILVNRPALMFSNPLIPYAWEAIDQGFGTGCYCIFNELFLTSNDRSSTLTDSPLLDISKERIYFLDDEGLKNVQEIFRKMKEALNSGYPHKSDVLRCYMHLLVHEARRVQPTNKYIANKNAGQRIVELFITLIERQFPVSIPHKPLRLRTAADYAERLSVHVNHLNRVVKASTGRTTSAIINNRIVQESVQLLQHSGFSIAEIAFALGFEEPASFSNFIKKHTGISPTEHRSPQIA